MKIYVTCYQHEPDCPTEIGPASRYYKIAAQALDKEFRNLIAPDKVNGEHGFNFSMDGGFVVNFSDPEGYGPSGHVEELEIEDE